MWPSPLFQSNTHRAVYFLSFAFVINRDIGQTHKNEQYFHQLPGTSDKWSTRSIFYDQYITQRLISLTPGRRWLQPLIIPKMTLCHVNVAPRRLPPLFVSTPVGLNYTNIYQKHLIRTCTFTVSASPSRAGQIYWVLWWYSSFFF